MEQLGALKDAVEAAQQLQTLSNLITASLEGDFGEASEEALNYAIGIIISEGFVKL